MNDFMRKFWWLRALPLSIQQSLLPVAETRTLDTLAIIADQMYASNPPVERVAEITKEQRQQVASEDQDWLGPYGGNPDDYNIAAMSNRFRNQKNQKRELFCKYHLKFGDQARKCIVGCAKYNSHSKN